MPHQPAERKPMRGPLPLDDHPGGHALDPPGGQPGHDLLPQDRRHLVAVEPVEDPPGLLGVDQAAVEVRHSSTARSMAGRVISWKTIRLTGTRGRQHLEQVPGDRLALAVLVRGQIDLARPA